MSLISNLTNKKPVFKSHLIPSVISAGVALAVAVPLTATLESASTIVAAAPVSGLTTPNTCSAVTTGVVGHAAHTITAPVGTTVSYVTTTTTPTTGSQNSGNGNTTSGSSASNNGNTSTNNGLVGVNANTSASLLNNIADNDLNNNLNNNNILDGNTVNVLNNPVQNNTVNVPVLNNVLDTLSRVKL